MLVGAEKMLQGSKKGMKMDLESAVDDFAQLVTETRKSSLQKLCYSDDFDIPGALTILSEWEDRTQSLRAKEEGLKPGLAIFGIEAPHYRGLEEIERDMDMLNRVWSIAAAWNEKWNEWKEGRFSDLDTPAMELEAAQFNRKVSFF